MATLKTDILQSGLEAFEQYITDNAPDGLLMNVKGKAKLYGLLVRAAASSDWFDSPLTDDDIGDMKGSAVVRLGMAVDDLYSEMVNVPE